MQRECKCIREAGAITHTGLLLSSAGRGRSGSCTGGDACAGSCPARVAAPCIPNSCWLLPAKAASCRRRWEVSPWKLAQLNGPLGSVEDTLHLQQAFSSRVSSALSLSIKADIHRFTDQIFPRGTAFTACLTPAVQSWGHSCIKDGGLFPFRTGEFLPPAAS